MEWASFLTKMINADYPLSGVSLDWATAWRGSLHVGPDRIRFGDREVPFSEMERTVLYSIGKPQSPRGYVLAFTHAGTPYQFGLNRSSFWEAPLPFPVDRQEAAPSVGMPGQAARVMLVAMPFLALLALLVVLGSGYVIFRMLG